METLDIIWIGSIFVGFITTAIIATVFFGQEGRTRVYLSSLLFAYALLGLLSLITAARAHIEDFWFKVPRTVGWSLVGIAGVLMILQQMNLINHKKQ